MHTMKEINHQKLKSLIQGGSTHPDSVDKQADESEMTARGKAKSDNQGS